MPSRDHTRAPKPATTLTDSPTAHDPSNLTSDADDYASQYVGRVHQYPMRSTRSGLLEISRLASIDTSTIVLEFTIVNFSRPQTFVPNMFKPHPLRLATYVFQFHCLYWSVFFRTRRPSPLHSCPELFLTYIRKLIWRYVVLRSAVAAVAAVAIPLIRSAPALT